MSRRPVVSPLSLASFLLLAGCGGAPSPDRIWVTCEPSRVVSGAVVQCTASTPDSTGQPTPVAPGYTWRLLEGAELATLNQEGRLVTSRPGSVRVAVSTPEGAPYVEGSTPVHIIEDPRPRLTALKPTCESTPLAVGKSVQCTASATDQWRQAFPVTRSTWTSDNEAVATVDASGKVSVLSHGATTLTVTATEGDITVSGSLLLTIGGPTEHRGPITASETWSRAGNPHLVPTTLVVGGPLEPILTLESGVEVLFGSGAALMIGMDEQSPGTLKVDGSTRSPVRFSARSDAPQPGHWAGVYFLRTSPNQSSTLSNAVIEYAGSALAGMPSTPGVQQFTGALNVLVDPDAQPTGTRIQVRNVEVRKSKEFGVVLGEAFTSGSTLNARDNGKAGLVAAANAVGSLSANSQFTGNGQQEALVWGGAVTESQTWPRLDVPYRLVSLVDSLPASISVGSARNPVLKLEAGTRLLMPAGSSFLVGLSEPGSLVARGNEDEPVRFVAESPSSMPGSWSGLHFLEARNSVLSYVQVSHAGAKLHDSLGGGAVNVYKQLGAFMTNSSLQDSSGCGVSVAARVVTTNFTQPEYGNVFLRLARANQCTQ